MMSIRAVVATGIVAVANADCGALNVTALVEASKDVKIVSSTNTSQACSSDNLGEGQSCIVQCASKYNVLEVQRSGVPEDLLKPVNATHAVSLQCTNESAASGNGTLTSPDAQTIFGHSYKNYSIPQATTFQCVERVICPQPAFADNTMSIFGGLPKHVGEKCMGLTVNNTCEVGCTNSTDIINPIDGVHTNVTCAAKGNSSTVGEWMWNDTVANTSAWQCEAPKTTTMAPTTTHDHNSNSTTTTTSGPSTTTTTKHSGSSAMTFTAVLVSALFVMQ